MILRDFLFMNIPKYIKLQILRICFHFTQKDNFSYVREYIEVLPGNEVIRCFLEIDNKIDANLTILQVSVRAKIKMLWIFFTFIYI